MIRKVNVIHAQGLYPYRNQAIEKYLLDSCQADEMTLYLWANDKTVFIGKNQNAFTECRLSALKEDGGFLARRFTGGGAVYHDKGNLNFSFILQREDYDLDNQFLILTQALRSLGFHAERSGRNDVLIDGKKFSGNAFFKSERNCLHHGTILISSDYDAIQRYLNASRVKLEAKGVRSVKSRVVNLREFSKDISADRIASAFEHSLGERYPAAVFAHLDERDFNEDQLKILEEKFSNENYILGDDLHYNVRFEFRFEWGVADIRLDLNGNVIEKAKIYSDALDPDSVAEKEELLRGTDVSKTPDPRIKDIIETLGVFRHEI